MRIPSLLPLLLVLESGKPVPIESQIHEGSAKAFRDFLSKAAEWNPLLRYHRTMKRLLGSVIRGDDEVQVPSEDVAQEPHLMSAGKGPADEIHFSEPDHNVRKSEIQGPKPEDNTEIDCTGFQLEHGRCPKSSSNAEDDHNISEEVIPGSVAGAGTMVGAGLGAGILGGMSAGTDKDDGMTVDQLEEKRLEDLQQAQRVLEGLRGEIGETLRALDEHESSFTETGTLELSSEVLDIAEPVTLGIMR